MAIDPRCNGVAVPARSRLPQRRAAETTEIAIGNTKLTATVGFDAAGRASEVFLSGAKDGSTMAEILDDASVVISVALQHGISARALAKSVSRTFHFDGKVSAASVIGAALDLVASYDDSPGDHPC